MKNKTYPYIILRRLSATERSFPLYSPSLLVALLPNAFGFALALLATLTLSHCLGNSGGGSTPVTTPIYFWSTKCEAPGNMVVASGDCSVATTAMGVAKADAICDKRAKTDAQHLPETHKTHKAMLNRGGSKHPKDIDIPNKTNREVHRLPTTKDGKGVKIINVFTSSTHRSYWGSGDVDNSVVDGKSDHYVWSGVKASGTPQAVSATCNGWTSSSGRSASAVGNLIKKSKQRFSSKSLDCNRSAFLLCASH